MLFPAAVLDVVLPLTSGHVRGQCFRVIDGKARLMPEYGTLYALPEARVFRRGGPKSVYSACPVCGSPRGVPVEPTYLLAFQVRPDRSTWQDQHGMLYVDERIAEAIERLRYPDVVLRPMPVRDKPIDNEWLPGDPNWWADE